jgi:DNA-binding transcriptional ArsR family regulator
MRENEREGARRERLRETQEGLDRARRALTDAEVDEAATLSQLLGAVSELVPDEDEGDPDPVRLEGEAAAGTLELLADPDCRCVLRAAGERPRTVPELEMRCGIARSTVYRKVAELTELGLLTERLRVDGAGPHPSEYRRAVDDVRVSVGSPLEVELRPARADGAAGAEPTAQPTGGGRSADDAESSPPRLIRLPTGKPPEQRSDHEGATRND